MLSDCWDMPRMESANPFSVPTGPRYSLAIRPLFLLTCIVAFLGGLFASTAWGGLNAPLAYDTAASMVDEFGNVLPGTLEEPGARVEILTADAGIYPPSTDGSPHPSNEVLAVTYIGAGVDPGAGALGKVSGALLIDRSNGARIFARIFNRPTREESSFYADSTVFTNPVSHYGVFVIDVTQIDRPLDTGDDDWDGLHNSWEKSYGTDKDNPDSDGDRVSDHDEVRAGTDPLDPASHLQMVRLNPVEDSDAIIVEWDAVAGKVYQLQHAEFAGDPADFYFTNVNEELTATGAVAQTIVTNLAPGVLRVRLVE